MPIILARFNSGYNQATKSEKVMKVKPKTGTWQCWTTNFSWKTSVDSVVLGILESRELTERTDWWAKQTPKWLASRKMCRTEELDTLHAAKKPVYGITPSIAWRREAKRDVRWKDEAGPMWMRLRMEPLLRQRWENLWEAGHGLQAFLSVGTTNQRNQLEDLWMTVTYLESVVWNVGSRQRDRRENL